MIFSPLTTMGIAGGQETVGIAQIRPNRLLCGHLLLQGKHGLPDAAAGVQFVFQLQSSRSFFPEQERSRKVFHNVENGRSQPFKVLRRICRG